MTRRHSVSAFPAAMDAVEARKSFETASSILAGASHLAKAMPSQESLQRASKVREFAARLVTHLEVGISSNNVSSVDDAAKALVNECLAVQRMTLQARKNK